jgi:hypothetical protein
MSKILLGINMEIDDGVYVLSLFDGISCGQQAFNKIGTKVLKYFSSEVDKYLLKNTLDLRDFCTTIF